jgi:hypothetical protein
MIKRDKRLLDAMIFSRAWAHGGCACVTRGGDRWLTELLGWSTVANEILQSPLL